MPSLRELELNRLREMTAAEKLAVADALWRQAWDLRRAAIARQHPDWPDQAVDEATRAALANAG